MKLVREHIEQFTRGRNPLKTLKIGKRTVIENWFKTWAPNNKYEIDDNLNIRVKRYLDLNRTNITSLPDNLHVEGWLDITETEVTFLPDNLYVEEWLALSYTKITSLPDNLYVGNNLHIRETKITSLPDDLHVKGKIYKDFK